MPAPPLLPSTACFEEEVVVEEEIYSEAVDEVGVVYAMLSALAVASVVVPAGEAVAQAACEALTLVGPYARPYTHGSRH